LSKIKNIEGGLLDIGCGAGMFLLNYDGGPKIGIDISLYLLKKAKNRVNSGNFINGDAENLSFLKDKSIDNIICTEVLEHLLNPENLTEEMKRIVKPNGLIFISTPNYKKKRPDWVEISGELSRYNLEGIDGKYYHTAYKPEELIGFFPEKQFEILDYGTFEKEIKIVSKIPALYKKTADKINKIFIHSQKISELNEKIFDVLSRYTFKILKPVVIILTRFIKSGVRSYVLIKKTYE